MATNVEIPGVGGRAAGDGDSGLRDKSLVGGVWVEGSDRVLALPRPLLKKDRQNSIRRSNACGVEVG